MIDVVGLGMSKLTYLFWGFGICLTYGNIFHSSLIYKVNLKMVNTDNIASKEIQFLFANPMYSILFSF